MLFLKSALRHYIFPLFHASLIGLSSAIPRRTFRVFKIDQRGVGRSFPTKKKSIQLLKTAFPQNFVHKQTSRKKGVCADTKLLTVTAKSVKTPISVNPLTLTVNCPGQEKSGITELSGQLSGQVVGRKKTNGQDSIDQWRVTGRASGW